jgi:hypothetical protein
MKQKIVKISIVSAILFFLFAPSSFADSLGQSKTFNVDSTYDYNGRTEIVTTLHYIGGRSYFYLENNWWNSLSSRERIQIETNIFNLSSEFDKIIYPKLTEFFGGVWDPGIDNDSRIVILMTKLRQDIGGYFNSCDEYSRTQCARSNEREMIHVNADFILDRSMKDFLAHELQHLIDWNQKERLGDLKEDVWTNEMRSEYAYNFLGYNNPYSESLLETRVKNFLDNQYDPLGEWRGAAGDYGAINLFAHYLANQFGENIFSSMSQNNLVGIISINQALKDAGYTEDFDEVFINWSLANYYNSLAIGKGGKYGYTNPSLKSIHISPMVNSFYSYGFVSFSESVKDWSPRWYLLKNNLSNQNNSVALKIEFKSFDPNANFKIPYMVHYKDGSYELNFMNLENQVGTSYIFNFSKDVESILAVPANHSKTTDFTNNDSLASFILKASTITVNQPVISSITPAFGPFGGGNSVTIKGGNFQQGIEVYFGGTKSSDVSFVSNTFLNVVVPPHEVGLVNVWIKNPDGQSSVFASGYEYKRGVISDGSLIRAKGDYKVYIVSGGYKRHILDSRIFGFYGHLNWASVIEATPEERDAYKTSAWVRADGDSKVYEVNGDGTKHWLNMTAEQFLASGRNWDGVFIINKQERDFYRTGASVLYR